MWYACFECNNNSKPHQVQDRLFKKVNSKSLLRFSTSVYSRFDERGYMKIRRSEIEISIALTFVVLSFGDSALEVSRCSFNRWLY